MICFLSGRWEGLAEEHGDIMAVMDPHHSPVVKLTYRELFALIQQFTAGLAELGLKRGDKVQTSLSGNDMVNLNPQKV